MPNDNRVFPAGTGGNPVAPQIGTIGDLTTTAQPPIRPPPDPFVLKSVEPFTDDDNISGFVDGQGNRIWHVDTSASAKAIVFMSVGESVDFEFVVKWVKGANPLTLTAAGGANIGGTATFAGVVAGDAYAFRSDGIEYHLVAQATNQGFLSSNSFSIFQANATLGNLTVTGSATFSGTVAFLTSINVSGTASINTLVVAGTASFSATVVTTGDVRVGGMLAVSKTLSVVGIITVGGVPLTSDWTKIASATITAATAMTFSGSWTAYSALRVEVAYLVSAGLNTELRLSSDNGTSYFLAGKAQRMPSTNLIDGTLIGTTIKTVTFTTSGFTVTNVEMKAVGINASPGVKYISGDHHSNGVWKISATISGSITAATTSIKVAGYNAKLWMPDATATVNTAQVNQISVAALNRAGTTQTMSGGVIYLYGLK